MSENKINYDLVPRIGDTYVGREGTSYEDETCVVRGYETVVNDTLVMLVADATAEDGHVYTYESYNFLFWTEWVQPEDEADKKVDAKAIGVTIDPKDIPGSQTGLFEGGDDLDLFDDDDDMIIQ